MTTTQPPLAVGEIIRAACVFMMLPILIASALYVIVHVELFGISMRESK